MGKMITNPRYRVISMRISKADHEYLKMVMMKTDQNISGVMREAMRSFILQDGNEERKLSIENM